MRATLPLPRHRAMLTPWEPLRILGWERVSAVRRGQIHELDGADVLSPGPSLMIGLRRIHEIVQGFQSTA